MSRNGFVLHVASYALFYHKKYSIFWIRGESVHFVILPSAVHMCDVWLLNLDGNEQHCIGDIMFSRNGCARFCITITISRRCVGTFKPCD